MSNDRSNDTFWDPKDSDPRLPEAFAWEDRALVVSGGGGQAENGKPSVSEGAQAPGTTGQLHSFLQRTVNARTAATEADSPEAWREVAAAAEELSKMAQRFAVVAEAKQRAEEFADTAEEANRTAEDQVRAAADAKQRAEELAHTAEEADRTAENQARAAAEAKQRAEELAHTAEEANRTAENQARAAAEARENLRRLETAAKPVTETNEVVVAGEVRREAVDTRVGEVTISSGSDQAPDFWAQHPAAREAPAERPHRRLLPRESDNQLGKYRIEDDVEHRWRPCRLTDISLAGAGVELLEMTSAARKGSTIILKFEDTAETRLLSGEICQVREMADGTVRIGLRFVELTEATLKLLKWLKESSVRW